jgi:outer membrane protein OmpA-like peptidoglycan-associated protein
MKMKTNFIETSRITRTVDKLTVLKFIFSALILSIIQVPLQAQQIQFSKPTWWFGIAGGANVNFYRGTTQELNSDLTVPAAFRHGIGIGHFLAPLVAYQRSDSRWGGMLQVGYDSRNASFNEILTPCNCPTNLSAKLGYITVEPSLRFSPFRSNFYLFGGPRLAFNTMKSFTYSQKTNPAFSEQAAPPDVKGDFSNVNAVLISMQIGAGYDIPLSSSNKQTQILLSPFVSFQPYFGQSPRSIETWTVTTLRIGAAIKIGRGRKLPSSTTNNNGVADTEVQFSVNSPRNIPVDRRVRETFPLRNYIFFNIGSNEIPDRYVLLSKDQVKDFKEDQLEVFTPKKLSGRSAREMVVYYNVINILGDRMGKNPLATITLVGSSQTGADDGKAMAESVKQYLTSVFGINASRITTEGREKPKIPSEQPGGTVDLTMLREGDNRVSIESSSPALLMEFQSGPDAPLKPVEFIAVQEAPLDSYVSFNVAKETFSSWSLEIRDEKGQVQNFGPYTQDRVSIPGKSILGARPEGNYNVTMVGQTKSGKTVKKETPVHMVLWKPSKDEEGMRFSVIFEFNESKALTMYEKYLTDIVTPKIPKGGKVIIHGYTDIIGDEANNMKLSWARANEVRSIIENALAKTSRKDVKFDVYGFGEDEKLSPFENKFPEERFYNRTVVIDIIPKK